MNAYHQNTDHLLAARPAPEPISEAALARFGLWMDEQLAVLEARWFTGRPAAASRSLRSTAASQIELSL